MRTPNLLMGPVVGLVLLGLGLTSAWADETSETSEAHRALEQAKVLYNNARYDEAATLYVRAAQLDPAGTESHGAPYRNLARCMFWLERYDAAVYWYDVYRSGWPQADDVDAVFAERRTADERRADSGEPLPKNAVYDRSVRELVDTLTERLEQGAPAATEQGGGTAHLYQLALDRGYASPKLAKLAATLRVQLLTELEVRWTPSEGAPMPLLGADSESIPTSESRLRILRTLAPRKSEVLRIEAYQRLVLGWADLAAGRTQRAAGEFKDASELLPKLPGLGYARAVALHQAGEDDQALEVLASAREVGGSFGDYCDLLSAEIERSEGHHDRAAALYWKVLSK